MGTRRLMKIRDDATGTVKIMEVVPDTITTTTTTPLSVPQNVTAVGFDNGTIKMTWAAPASTGGSAIIGYKIGRDGTDIYGTGAWETTRPIEYETFFSHLQLGVTYNVWVQAITASTQSLKVYVSVLVPNPPPVNPTNSPYSFAIVDEANMPLNSRNVFGHVMSNFYLSDSDKSFGLIYMGDIATSADKSAKSVGFGLADCGKTWKATDTGIWWVWNGTAWEDYGNRPAWTTIGARYPNPKDYHVNHFLPPATAAGTTKQAHMGDNRDRTPDTMRHGGTKAQWMVANFKTECREWWSSGINILGAHMVDIGQTSGHPHWQRAVWLLDAVEQMNREDGSKMRVILQPDGTTSSTTSVKNADGTVNYIESGKALGRKILTLKGRPGLFTIDGKVVVSPFGCDLGGTSQQRFDTYKAMLDVCNAGGMPIFFWALFLKQWTLKFPLWETITDGVAEWGPADPTAARSTSTRNKAMSRDVMNALGLPTHIPVRPGDYRPRQKSCFESRGFSTLDETWRTALGIGGWRPADMVQLVTLNDIGEHSHLQRSVNNGWALLDYNRYWLQWYRTRTQPRISADVLYLAHRSQFFSGMDFTTGMAPAGKTTPVITQTSFTTAHPSNQEPFVNEIDVRADLKEAATVIVSVNGTDVATFSGVSGRNEFKCPLQVGKIAVRAIRNGTQVARVDSRHEVVRKWPYEDKSYKFHSSARQAMNSF